MVTLGCCLGVDQDFSCDNTSVTSESFCQLAVSDRVTCCERLIPWPQGSMSPCDRHGLNSGTKQARLGQAVTPILHWKQGTRQLSVSTWLHRVCRRAVSDGVDLLFHLLADHRQWYFTHCRAGGPRGAGCRGTRVIGEAGRHTAAVFIWALEGHRPGGWLLTASSARAQVLLCKQSSGFSLHFNPHFEPSKPRQGLAPGVKKS